MTLCLSILGTAQYIAIQKLYLFLIEVKQHLKIQIINILPSSFCIASSESFTLYINSGIFASILALRTEST